MWSFMTKGQVFHHILIMTHTYIHTFERPIIHEQSIMDDTHEQSDCKYEAFNRKLCCSAFSTKQPPRTSASADQHRLHCGVNFCMGKNLVHSYHAVQAIFYLPVCETDRFETPGLWTDVHSCLCVIGFWLTLWLMWILELVIA